MGTLVYYKSFKINKTIATALEKYEGYNNHAQKEIENRLQSVGYPSGVKVTCPKNKDGGTLQTPVSTKYPYCIYYIGRDDQDSAGTYYSFGIQTYITFDIPLVNLFLKIPIYTKSNRIYKFS